MSSFTAGTAHQQIHVILTFDISQWSTQIILIKTEWQMLAHFGYIIYHTHQAPPSQTFRYYLSISATLHSHLKD